MTHNFLETAKVTPFGQFKHQGSQAAISPMRDNGPLPEEWDVIRVHSSKMA